MCACVGGCREVETRQQHEGIYAGECAGDLHQVGRVWDSGQTEGCQYGVWS